VEAVNLQLRVASRLGLRRRTTTAIVRAIPTADALTVLRSAPMETRRAMATVAAIRSSALTIRRPRARTMRLRVRTRRRELIPLRAAAIQPRLAPTPHPAIVAEGAAAIAAAEAVVTAVAVAAVVVEAIVAVATVVVARAAVVAAIVAAVAHAAAAAAEVRMAVEVVGLHAAVEAPLTVINL
jgi:hypothetical protein